MKIIVDAMGGDNAPLSVVAGCAAAVAEAGCEILLVGDQVKIEKHAADNGISLKNIEIFHTDEVFDMDDDASEIVKAKSGTSMAVALKKLVDGEGNAMISAGSTAALLVGATFIVKRIRGVKRAALTPVIPAEKGPFLLIDCGANLEVRPEILAQFGAMGSIYMDKVVGVKNPRVGLLNVGVEETKGGETLTQAYGLLKNSELNFVGNVEPREVPASACDVLVCDGFSGNIVLKLTEGVASFFMKTIKGILMKNIFTKFAAMLIKPGLMGLKQKMDTDSYGGAPLLGISKPVMKAHGNSNEKTIKFAVLKAIEYAQSNAICEIEAAIKR